MQLPGPIFDVILKACADRIDTRHQTPAELVAALREARREVDWEETTGRSKKTPPPPPAPSKIPPPPGKMPPAKAAPPPRAAPPAYAAQPAVVVSDPHKTEPRPPVLVVQSLANPEIVAAGRRVRLLGAGASFVHSPARLRVTVLPHVGLGSRMHVKGLNCFVTKSGSRPSSAVDIWADCDLQLTASDRAVLDTIQVHFGVVKEDVRTFQMQSGVLTVPLAVAPVSLVLDYGPGREIVLVYQRRRSAA
jgi:hypothetical protein